MGNWTRRDFLAGSGITAGALALGAGCTSNGGTSTGSTGDDNDDNDFDAKDWSSVRDQFTLNPNLLHYAAYLLAGHPRPVAEAVASYREDLDRDPQRALADAGTLEGNARDLAGTYLNADPEDVALTDSTTAGLGLVYGGLRLTSQTDVVTTVHDHYATHEALRLAAARSGAQVRRIALYGNPAQATVDGIVGRIVDAIIPATRVVALTWVHSSTGVKLPVTSITQAIAAINARRDEAGRILVCLDGAHGLGVEARTVNQLGVDFLIAGTHKWLFGPRGTGLVWGKPEAWARITPSVPSFAPIAIEAWANGTDPVRKWPGQLATPGGYHSFEHRWALGEAFKFHLMIGRDRVADRTHVQATALKAALAEIGGVTVVTPVDESLSSGIVAVQLARRDPFELVELLRGRNIVASVGPHTPRYVRFGPSMVTTPDEGEELVESIAALA
ncbi:MAG TPA: aminotransferase class V-fold PLP-dependent enzyme [Acidimicrobiales bacterium]|nr:aminotransferase class V-fold PLP-dependent enzyme [Acidimicrobiales bacterium]